MLRKYLLLSIGYLVITQVESAATVSLNIGSGYLYGSTGTAVVDRLPADSLCVLVADLDGNGFDPINSNGGWVGGGDVLIEVSDIEYATGSFGFDLTSSVILENGFLSRTLVIDLAQFGSRVAPLSFALRWFPTLNAATTDLLTTSPAFDTPYGEFSRAVPIYQGTSAWVINMSGGEILDLDPLATPDFGGTDSPESAMASFTVVPEPSSFISVLAGFALLFVRRRRIQSNQ